MLANWIIRSLYRRDTTDKIFMHQQIIEDACVNVHELRIGERFKRRNTPDRLQLKKYQNRQTRCCK